MIQSNIRPVGQLSLPAFAGMQVYMHPILVGERVTLPEGAEGFEEVVEKMLAMHSIPAGEKIFVTVDQSRVKAGKSHRRPGAHVDGNFIFDWTGGWLTGVDGRVLSPENHQLQYCNPMGGLLIVSDLMACRAWLGEFAGVPNQGGDCSHLTEDLERNESFLLEPNQVYVGNSTCVHESLPVDQDVERTLVRITLSPNIKVH